MKLQPPIAGERGADFDPAGETGRCFGCVWISRGSLAGRTQRQQRLPSPLGVSRRRWGLLGSLQFLSNNGVSLLPATLPVWHPPPAPALCKGQCFETFLEVNGSPCEVAHIFPSPLGNGGSLLCFSNRSFLAKGFLICRDQGFRPSSGFSHSSSSSSENCRSAWVALTAQFLQSRSN